MSDDTAFAEKLGRLRGHVASKGAADFQQAAPFDASTLLKHWKQTDGRQIVDVVNGNQKFILEPHRADAN